MSRSIQTTNLIFTAPYDVTLAAEMLAAPAAGQVLVRTLLSAISAGTELLFYRGQAPAQMSADATIAALSHTAQYPLKYGYTLVGEVIALGAGVAVSWLGQPVLPFTRTPRIFWLNRQI
jgi:NADPH:quinone reductase-like Zn-dependent oxidoreductase